MSVNLIIVAVAVHSDIVAGTMDSGATTAVLGESIRIYSTSGEVTSQSLWSRYTIAILYKSLFTEEIGSTQTQQRKHKCKQSENNENSDRVFLWYNTT